MQSFRFPEDLVLPEVSLHTGVAPILFWCFLVGNLLTSVCMFSLFAVFRLVIGVSADVTYLFGVASLGELSVFEDSCTFGLVSLI